MTDQNINALIGYLGNPPIDNKCIGYLCGRRLKEEYAGSEKAVIKELTGPPLQIIIEISKYTDVLLIDEVNAGQQTGEILIFDINDMCDHIATFYINGVNLSEAIASGKQLGIPIPKHFLLAGIEVGEGGALERHETDTRDSPTVTVSLLLQKNMEEIFQTLHSIITDFLNNTI